MINFWNVFYPSFHTWPKTNKIQHDVIFLIHKMEFPHFLASQSLAEFFLAQKLFAKNKRPSENKRRQRIRANIEREGETNHKESLLYLFNNLLKSSLYLHLICIVSPFTSLSLSLFSVHLCYLSSFRTEIVCFIFERHFIKYKSFFLFWIAFC